MRRLTTLVLAMSLLGAAVPAAAAGPPTITEELLSGFVTEEVEPGVLRVVNDGVRDLSKANNRYIVAGHDGGIWVIRQNRFLRLGTGGTHESRDADIEVAPDGTVWAVWTHADGTGTVARLEADGWEPLDGEAPPVPGWDRHPDRPWGALLVSQTGELWLNSPVTWMAPFDSGGPLFRYEGDGWHELDAPGQGHAALGTDGTLWLWYRQAPPADCGFNAMGPDCDYAPDTLARFDGSEWQRFDSQSGVPLIGFGVETPFEAGPDGSVWAGWWEDLGDDRKLECGGLARHDGTTFERYLEGHCVISMDIAADGSVWLLADNDLYVITPEAVATAE